MFPETATDYYTRQTKKLLRDHDRFYHLGRPVMRARYGPEFAETVASESLGEFRRLLPEIPYIGGNANSFTELMVQMTSLLSIYRVMKRQGKTVAEIGDFVREMAQAWVNRHPPLVLSLLGRLYMSQFWRKRLRNRAAESQKRRFPGNFVYEIVAGDGKAFEWGVNYLECGVVNFFHQQGADEFTPYACQLDYLLFPALGIELKRQGTIAQGCSHCDFRFKRPAVEH